MHDQIYKMPRLGPGAEIGSAFADTCCCRGTGAGLAGAPGVVTFCVCPVGGSGAGDPGLLAPPGLIPALASATTILRALASP